MAEAMKDPEREKLSERNLSSGEGFIICHVTCNVALAWYFALLPGFASATEGLASSSIWLAFACQLGCQLHSWQRESSESGVLPALNSFQGGLKSL